MVTAIISIDVPVRGKSYWKLNCHYLRHDAHFVDFIKSKIVEFKDIHCNSDVNPNILWDTLKCFVTGHCISYTSRKNSEKSWGEICDVMNIYFGEFSNKYFSDA